MTHYSLLVHDLITVWTHWIVLETIVGEKFEGIIRSMVHLGEELLLNVVRFPSPVIKGVTRPGEFLVEDLLTHIPEDSISKILLHCTSGLLDDTQVGILTTY